MAKKRVSFTSKQKHDFAKMIVEDGCTIPQVMQIANASESAVSRWKKQYLAEKSGTTTNHATGLTPEYQKIKMLEKKLARAERDLDIVKKAAALFVQDTQVKS